MSVNENILNYKQQRLLYIYILINFTLLSYRKINPSVGSKLSSSKFIWDLRHQHWSELDDWSPDWTPCGDQSWHCSQCCRWRWLGCLWWILNSSWILGRWRRNVEIFASWGIFSEVQILAVPGLEMLCSLIQCSSTLMQKLAAVWSSWAECPGCGAPPVLGTCALATRWTPANVPWPWCKWSGSRTVWHLWM